MIKKLEGLLLALILVVSLAVPVGAAATDTTPSATAAQSADPMRWAIDKKLFTEAAATGDTVTHALVADALYRMSGSPAVTGCSFSDLRIGEAGWSAARWAVDNGAFFMYDNGAFAPGNTLTLTGLIKVMHRYALACGYAKADVYRASVSWALETGVLTTDEDGGIRTDIPATGRDLAQALYGFNNYYHQRG